MIMKIKYSDIEQIINDSIFEVTDLEATENSPGSDPELKIVNLGIDEPYRVEIFKTAVIDKTIRLANQRGVSLNQGNLTQIHQKIYQGININETVSVNEVIGLTHRVLGAVLPGDVIKGSDPDR